MTLGKHCLATRVSLTIKFAIWPYVLLVSQVATSVLVFNKDTKVLCDYQTYWR